jgi:hypothetical protein
VLPRKPQVQCASGANTTGDEVGQLGEHAHY